MALDPPNRVLHRVRHSAHSVRHLQLVFRRFNAIIIPRDNHDTEVWPGSLRNSHGHRRESRFWRATAAILMPASMARRRIESDGAFFVQRVA